MSKLLKFRYNLNLLSRAGVSNKFFDEFAYGQLYSAETERERNLINVRSVASIENKARNLLHNVIKSQSERISLIHLENLVIYLKNHHIAREKVFQDNGISHLLNLFYSIKDVEIRKQARLALALLGYVEPVKARGIRILSLDGGGTRGMMTIRMLKEISDLCKKPIHELFDLIIGTSTGAILAILLGVYEKPLPYCKSLYDKLCSEIFKASRLTGTTQLFVNHAYYDTAKLETILKDELGEEPVMIDSAIHPGPKVAVVSTLVNHQQLQAYVFRNYCLPANRKSFYGGSSKHKIWQAVRASTAAPGFFEELKLDNDIHQDGGLLNNNPAAIAVNEAKAVWPDTPIQAIVSIGTGSYHGRAGPKSLNFTTLREKLLKLVNSATDVEGTHTILQDLLPSSTYIRLNPNMSADIPLDVCEADMLLQLEQDTCNYILKFSHKFEMAAEALSHDKKLSQKVREEVNTQFYRKGWL